MLTNHLLVVLTVGMFRKLNLWFITFALHFALLQQASASRNQLWLLTVHVIGILHHLYFYVYVHCLQSHTSASLPNYVQWVFNFFFNNSLTYYTLLHYISDLVCYGNESGPCDMSCSTKSHTLGVFILLRELWIENSAPCWLWCSLYVRILSALQLGAF